VLVLAEHRARRTRRIEKAREAEAMAEAMA